MDSFIGFSNSDDYELTRMYGSGTHIIDVNLEDEHHNHFGNVRLKLEFH
jgi:hypothetical protein